LAETAGKPRSKPAEIRIIGPIKTFFAKYRFAQLLFFLDYVIL
jgi:hypothetical protein